MGAGTRIVPSARVGAFALIGAGSTVLVEVPDRALILRGCKRMLHGTWRRWIFM